MWSILCSMKQQISNRLGVAHVRDTMMQFITGAITRQQAMESLQVGSVQAAAATAGRMVGADLVGMEGFDDRAARAVAGRRRPLHDGMRERNPRVDLPTHRRNRVTRAQQAGKGNGSKGGVHQQSEGVQGSVTSRRGLAAGCPSGSRAFKTARLY